MPVGRSPPKERFRSPAEKQLTSANSSYNVPLSASEIKSKSSAIQPHLTTAVNSIPTTPLSWIEQCQTPIDLINISHPTTCLVALTSATTITTVTTTASTSRTVTTNSSIFSYSPIMSTCPNIAMQAKAGENKKELSLSKRTRNSPDKNTETTKSTKKHKTLANQKTITTYWLSKPTNNTSIPHTLTSNRFDILSLDDENEKEKVTQNSGTNNTNEQQKSKTPKPPPIFVQNVEYIKYLTDALNKLPNCVFELKVLQNNEVKIQPKESYHYTQISKLLKEKNTQYYTYKPKEQRGFKVILRNLHNSTDKDEIVKELGELGHEVTNIHNILHATTKAPLPLFILELKTKPNNKDIYTTTHLLHCKIKFEPPHQKRSLPQCTNCQKYGHTKNFCFKTPVCVKCAGSHKAIECPVKDINEIKCALCGKNHTANYKGCMIYKSLKIQQFPSLRQKNPTTITSTEEKVASQITLDNVTTQHSTTTPNLSYAQVTAINAKNDAQSIGATITENKEISELKDMMKQLISQMSAMINMITLLFAKFNEQTR